MTYDRVLSFLDAIEQGGVRVTRLRVPLATYAAIRALLFEIPINRPGVLLIRGVEIVPV